MLHRNDGFGVSKVMTSTQDKKKTKNTENRQKLEDMELEALLSEDDLQTQ